MGQVGGDNVRSADAFVFVCARHHPRIRSPTPNEAKVAEPAAEEDGHPTGLLETPAKTSRDSCPMPTSSQKTAVAEKLRPLQQQASSPEKTTPPQMPENTWSREELVEMLRRVKDPEKVKGILPMLKELGSSLEDEGRAEVADESLVPKTEESVEGL